jgi:hypothetical protein
LAAVRTQMEDYAKRGVFRGFHARPIRHGVAAFRVIWHRDRIFDLIVDARKETICIPVVLPEVPMRSPLWSDFKAFVQSHHAASLPDHRRVEKSKARLRCANLRRNVSLTIAVKDGDYEYALQRLIHLVHETYLIFLTSGPYRDYLAEVLGAEMDIG